MKEITDFLIEAQKNNLVINFLQVFQGEQKIGEYQRIATKTRLNVYSISKSVTSLAAGIALKEGLFTLDDQIGQYFAEYDLSGSKAKIGKIKIKNLLTMTCGLADPLFFLDDPGRYQIKDWLAYFFNSRFSDQPGEVFKYTNFGPYVLGCIIERLTGEKLKDYLTPRLFTKLAIGNPNWLECPKQHTMAASALFLTIDELSRLGLLLLNNGKYHGQQIVSADYVKAATRNQLQKVNEDAKNGYGYGFWINDDLVSYRAEGKYGQFIFVLPQKKLMVTCQAFDDRDVYQFVWDKLIEKL
jgi:CubicO group peptidase (beta-lactamase class C family)